ncbi:hypothetical protein PGT21_015542 [Puccinia graminis f. sp. tritici]|uniref:Uncharacterized protein n=1 Tax=Puccinia graminis f. sp. tritici TaxID=56615 RepID=A0A5B0NV26_PUCGR|nr:hypothetical protein PGTUg99_005081 [Puccinia graminis f. sp. tritici]KAA1092833.1 hypothetical protein PGT21_015542 [Puccinia graminis f. sp. tritici]
MDDSLAPEMTQVVELLPRYESAADPKGSRRGRRPKLYKDLSLTVESKILTLRELFLRVYDLEGVVTHPRIWTLQSQSNSTPQAILGTPPVPRPSSHGLLRHRLSRDLQQDIDDLVFSFSLLNLDT